MFDQKEDLRLRMADLEKKLAESEEERCKLEKTCNVLMRAFREEEKMHYKALNQKYEKFLEDCTVRKRRNDIILRSLCRIEDRSRALFAKTERLKLLKDRYVSYLNINDYRKGDSTLRTLPFPSPRYVRWTTPLATHLKTERLRDAVRDALEGNRTSDAFSEHLSTEEIEKPEEKQRCEGRKPSDVKVLNGVTPKSGDILNMGAHRVLKEIKNDQLPRIMQGNHLSDKTDVTFREEKVYHEAEKLKKAEEENVGEGGKVSTTKENDAPFPRINYNWNNSPRNEEKQEEDLINRESEIKSAYREESESPPGNENPLPKGLDGVDYQNETYPESYYEQPVHHHNHTSIASDVILEEDEQELAEEDYSFRETQLKEGDQQSPRGQEAVGEPEWTSETNKQMDEPSKGHAVSGKVSDEVRSRGSESEKSSEGKRSEKSEENPSKNKGGVRSNLIHLLESDSESFQIEHGDVVSGNEDSDFDFSFNQN